MAFIECRGLYHDYNAGMENEYRALDNVSLGVEKGEFVTILGTNGSGKSTLAKHFNALLQPTAGKCLVDGIDTSDEARLWDIRSRVGMVFQNPDNQIIAAIVEDDIGFGPENIGMEPHEIRRRVTAALKAVNMEEFRHFAPHLLSGGQKQRVAIAGALAMLSWRLSFLVYLMGGLSIIPVVLWMPDEKIAEKTAELYLTGMSYEEAFKKAKEMMKEEDKTMS